jgi:hypothetical protein
MELTHFASFLNAQLFSSENSVFTNADLVREDLPGMKMFVVRFLIQMSKDFATRSVEVSDQSQGEGFSRCPNVFKFFCYLCFGQIVTIFLFGKFFQASLTFVS